MKSYCLKCKKDTENINPRISNTTNSKTMLLSKFIKNQKAKILLINLKIRIPLNKVPLLGDILF